MGIDKIAVLRVAPNWLDRFSSGEGSAAEGFQLYAGESPAIFHARALSDSVLVRPVADFATTDDLAIGLRGILGAALDAHDDERGIAVIAEPPAEDARYADLVGAATWVPRVAADDERVFKGTGSAFAMAASELSGAFPDVAKKVEEKASDDPIGKAEDTFGRIFSERNERGNLRKKLSASVDGAIENSALGAYLPEESKPEALEKSERDMADVLERGTGGNPEKTAKLEGMLRDVVAKGEIAQDSGDVPPPPPAEEPGEGEKSAS